MGFSKHLDTILNWMEQNTWVLLISPPVQGPYLLSFLLLSFFPPVCSLASEDIKQKDRQDHIYAQPVFTGPEPGAGNGHRTGKPTMNVEQSGKAPF